MNEKILSILKEIRPEFDFDGVEDFFEEGMLDSFDLVTLCSELDKAFNIHIDGMDIIPENFMNVSAIANLLKKNGVN
ncbi:MAG: acyl carrier protein [Treponema sp.]|nr:acyl carrier protein [Treponema sp.]